MINILIYGYCIVICGVGALVLWSGWRRKEKITALFGAFVLIVGLLTTAFLLPDYLYHQCRLTLDPDCKHLIRDFKW